MWMEIEFLVHFIAFCLDFLHIEARHPTRSEYSVTILLGLVQIPCFLESKYLLATWQSDRKFLKLLQSIGSLAVASYFTVFILSVIVTFHRLFCTSLPFTASNYLRKSLLQVRCFTAFLNDCDAS